MNKHELIEALKERKAAMEIARDAGYPFDALFYDAIVGYLASLTADSGRLAELAQKVREIRQDAKYFDGDRRGMWECQEECEQALLEEAVKYTAPVDLTAVLDSFNSRGYEIDGNGITLENLARAVEVVFSQLDEYAEMAAQVDLAALVPDVLTLAEASKHTAGRSFAETLAFSDGVNWMRAEILRRIEQHQLDEKRQAFIGSVTDTTPQQFESLASGGDKKKT